MGWIKHIQFYNVATQQEHQINHNICIFAAIVVFLFIASLNIYAQ